MDIFDAPGVNDAWGDVAGVDEVAQPLSRVRVYFVVVGGHGSRNRKTRYCGPVCGVGEVS